MNDKFKKFVRACPICSSGEGLCLGPLEYALFDDCPMTNRFDIVFCPECAFVFYDTPDTTEQFGTFYRDHYFSSSYTSNAKDAPEYEPVVATDNDPLEILKGSLTSQARICEIGCGRGSLLQRFKNAGFENLFGIEPSEQCVDYVRRNLGIEVRSGTVSDTPFDVEFDLILSTHVLEHVLDLAEAAENVAAQLAQGGLAYIEVPDLDKYDVEEGMNPLDYLTIFEHINHFTLDSLENLFSRYGLVMVDSGRKLLAKDTRLPLPAIYGIFKKEQKGAGKLSTEDKGISDRVLGWLDAGSYNQDERLADLAKSGKQVYVWGINLFVQKMLAMSFLRDCNIVGLVDRDPAKQKKTINGQAITSPEVLKDASSEAVVVIWGGPYRKSIEQELADMNFQGRTIIL